MTTDLSNKSVEELFMDNYSHEDWEVVAQELASRLEEAQQRNAAHDAKVAAKAIGRCGVAVRGLTGLIHKAQERLTKYLVPDSDGDAHACISDVLDLLDGPEWREAERKAILATAPAISPPFTDPNASIAAEVLGHAIGRLSSDSYFVGAEEAIRIVEELAAEYRAKAAEAGRKE